MSASKSYVHYIGWVASLTAVLMFATYIDQIRLNLAGHKGSPLQAGTTVLNCSLWIVYAIAKPKRDWPMIIANFPGVLLGAIAFFTSL
jgi:uncharacterized protein with PQ loop repeat